MEIKKRFLLILVLYYVYIIFSFSVKPATISGAESSHVAEFIYNLLIFVFPVPKENFLQVFEPVLRKIAHFSNFFILSVIMSGYISCYIKKLESRVFLSLSFCLLVAVFDESLQLFSVGRACRIFDVYIDFIGAALGIFLYNLPGALFYKVDFRRESL